MKIRNLSIIICLLVFGIADADAQLLSRVTASTVDGDGNVSVTGWRVTERGPGGTYVADIATVKYDRHGNVMWIDRFPPNAGFGEDEVRNSEGWGIAADRFGNLYVAGHAGKPGAPDVDCLLMKYPANHQQGDGPEWVRRFDGGMNLGDQNWSITVDPDGFIYTVGRAVPRLTATGAGDADLTTMKFDTHGKMVWPAPVLYNGPASLNDVGVAIVVDPLRKNVFVTGFSLRPGGQDMLTVMYDASGVQKWAQHYAGPINGHNRGTSMGLDAEGNIYVTGWSQGEESLDFATIKYDVNGNEKWIARYDGPGAANDQPAPLIVGGVGAVGAIGSYIQTNQGIIVTPEVIDPVPALDYLIDRVQAAELSRGLQASLVMRPTLCRAALLAPNAAVRRNAAHLLEAFMHHVDALSKAGHLTAMAAVELRDIAEHIRKGILGIPTTVVYVGGQSTGVDTKTDFAIVKYNGETGRPMWNLADQPGTTPGQQGQPARIALRYNGPVNDDDRVMGMAMNQDGEVFVTGMSTGKVATPPLGLEFYTAKYAVNSFTPQKLAEARYNGPLDVKDGSTCFGIWRDPDSGRMLLYRDPITGKDLIVVGGDSGQASDILIQYMTIVYDADLEPLWMHTFFD
jgi:hypothetical protein